VCTGRVRECIVTFTYVFEAWGGGEGGRERVPGGHYMADKGSDGASEGDAVVYIGVNGQGQGGLGVGFLLYHFVQGRRGNSSRRAGKWQCECGAVLCGSGMGRSACGSRHFVLFAFVLPCYVHRHGR
jgi:hypothetical protein